MRRWAALMLGALAAVSIVAIRPLAAQGAPIPPPEVAGVPVVLLADPGGGRVLFARQAHLRFVPASMTKVMSAYVAIEEMSRGRLKREQMFTVSPAIAAEWNGRGTSLYLRAQDRISTDQLLRAITTVSANDAAMVLATGHAGSLADWAILMNAEARRLGMADSRFATPNGWPDGGATYVSAHDLVRLGAALVERHPAEYRRYFGQKTLTFRGVTQANRDPVLGVVAGADGIKTGHTKEAGYNFLGSAQRNGRRLYMVIAGAGSEAQRAAASRALLEWGFSAWQARPLFPSGGVVGKARVQGGDARSVRLMTPRAIHATVPRGEPVRLRLRIRYAGPLVAPIAKGQEVARLEIFNSGDQVGSVPLLAATAVGPAGPLDKMLNAVIGMFS